MAEAVAAVDYLPQVRPKVAVSVHRKLLSAAGMSTHHSSSSSSEREKHDGTGNEQREGAGAVAPTPASNRTMKPVTNVTTQPQERLDD
jgi:hypothetical protein